MVAIARELYHLRGVVAECLLKEDLRGFGPQGGDVGVFEDGGEVDVCIASQLWGRT